MQAGSVSVLIYKKKKTHFWVKLNLPVSPVPEPAYFGLPSPGPKNAFNLANNHYGKS